MDVLAILLVAVPVIAVPMRSLGFDPIWRGIVLTIVMEMGLTTPPFGMKLFVVQGVASYTGYPISYSDAVAGSTPYLIADAVALLLVILFPTLALWLPSLI
jgi:TRAP-type C4-dicarboxylate transport system permease large subunit